MLLVTKEVEKKARDNVDSDVPGIHDCSYSELLDAMQGKESSHHLDPDPGGKKSCVNPVNVMKGKNFQVGSGEVSPNNPPKFQEEKSPCHSSEVENKLELS